MRRLRAALALVLAFAVPVRAETTSDPLWTMLSTYVLTPDPRAPEAGEGDPKSLAGYKLSPVQAARLRSTGNYQARGTK